MVTYDWTEEMCRHYADGLRPIVRFDHARWAKRIARDRASWPTGAALVDIATGPAFLLVEIGKRVPGLKLIAQDQAEPMLAIARQEAAGAGLTIRTVCCAAERLALEDGEADVVTCKQLLHEANEVAKVIAETARILKPGGRLYLIDFDADGSLLAALTVRTLLFVTRGTFMGNNFWRSFRSGLAGARVRASVLRAGFAKADYVRSGFNYLIAAVR
jgi:ubiquinone/menaquinone biosynthesis C-methylase UbiE